jgi:REP element-mobilizing transposase RayT
MNDRKAEIEDRLFGNAVPRPIPSHDRKGVVDGFDDTKNFIPMSEAPERFLTGAAPEGNSSHDREGVVNATEDVKNHSLTVAAPELLATPRVFDEDWQGACRTIAKAETEPRTYFITFTCYGTWLHGDKRGSIDLEHNFWQSPPLEPDEERERHEFELLKHSPVELGADQLATVHHTIEEVCTHRGWWLHALNVRTNHVHVVVTANRRGKRVYNDFKSYATRRMKEANCLPAACLEVFEKDGDRSRERKGAEEGSPGIADGRSLTVAAPGGGTDSFVEAKERSLTVAAPEFKVWTRGGSARVIDTENSFRRAIEYTLHEQGPDITPTVP